MQSRAKINTNWIIGVIAIVHLVGLVGLLIPVLQPCCRMLIPCNIFLTLLIVLFFHDRYNRNFMLSMLLISSAGFLIEVLGVSTKLIFGAYYYQSFLGPKIASVPLLIGLNWFLLVCCSSSLVSSLKWNLFLKSLLVAGIMLLTDFFLEYFAIHNHLWVWIENGNPPLQNFVAWFFVSLLFAFFYNRLNQPILFNRVANWALIIMCCFFVVFDCLIYFRL